MAGFRSPRADVRVLAARGTSRNCQTLIALKQRVLNRTLPAVLNLNLYLIFLVSLPFHGSPDASELRMYWIRAAT